MIFQLFATLLTLFLLLGSAQGQTTGFITGPSCSDPNLSPVDDETVCLQTVSGDGRLAGHIYVRRSGAWVDIEGSVTPGGSDTHVQFNDGGSALGGDAGLTYDKDTDTLSVAGDVVVAGQSVCQADGTNCPSAGAETDPIVGAITGIPKADGAGNISAATPGTDYAGLSSNNNFTGTTRVSETLESDAATPAQITASQDDYAGCDGKIICRLTLDSDWTITSIASGGNWRWLQVWNIDDTDTLTLEHQSASGTAANRIISTTGFDVVLTPGQVASCVYDNTSSSWRCLNLGAGGISAEVDTLNTVHGRGNHITGATTFGTSVRIGGATNFWAIYEHASLGLQLVCAPGGLENDCDYLRLLAAGKEWGAKDSSDVKRIWYTEGGQVKISTDFYAEATGSDLGSATKAFQDLYLHGSGTYGSHSGRITGAFTTNRVITLPDATDTVVGKATTDTLTNKTIDAEATGNVITIPREDWFDSAACQNTTASHIWDVPTTNSPAATCDTGTNTQKGYLAFDAATDESIQQKFRLPTGFTGAIDIIFRWKAAATTGATGWCAQLVRVPDGATSDPAFPAQAAGNCVSDAAKGTTLQENEATISGVTCTSCVAGDLVYMRLSRDANGSAVTDDMTGDALLLGWMRRIRQAL